MSIVNIFVRTIKEHSFILNRDFNELVGILPHKREVYINKGVNIFLKKVMESMQIFNISVQHYIDTKPTEAMLGMVISMNIYKDNYINEFIIFDPIRGNVFFTDKDKLYFNNNIIFNQMNNVNKLVLNSTNPLFLHNLYPCHLLYGCFQRIEIESEHIERNKYAIEFLKRHSKINIIKDDQKNNISIFLNS